MVGLTAPSRRSDVKRSWRPASESRSSGAPTPGVARRIAADADVAVLHLEHLTKEALRAAFASCATDHAAASVLRAHSSWSRFFDFLVAEDLVEGNPMAAVPKPRRVDGAPRAIRDPDAAARLLATAAQPDPRGRNPWPERDLALVATFCVTGIR
jgi:site-specific recombinase XerC